MWAEISAHKFFSQAGSIFLMAYLLGFDIIEFIKIIYNLFAKIGDVFRDNAPDYNIIYLKILMNNVITHTSDLLPRSGRMRCYKLCGKQIGCFTNNLNVLNHCIIHHIVGFKIFKGLTRRIANHSLSS